MRDTVGGSVGRGEGFVGGIRALVDADEATQCDGQMRDPGGLDDGEYDSAPNLAASIVFAVGFRRANEEVDDVARAPRSDGQGEAREEGAGRGLVFGGGGRGVVAIGEGDHRV